MKEIKQKEQHNLKKLNLDINRGEAYNQKHPGELNSGMPMNKKQI